MKPCVPIDLPRWCQFRRKDGRQCKARAQAGADFCFFHDPAVAEERAAARRAGGVQRTRKVVLPKEVPSKQLRTVTDVVELLGETINHVRHGEIDLRASNAIGYLSAILLNAIEKSSVEERLAALEAAVANPSHSQTTIGDEDGTFEFIQKQTAPDFPDDQTKAADPN